MTMIKVWDELLQEYVWENEDTAIVTTTNGGTAKWNTLQQEYVFVEASKGFSPGDFVPQGMVVVK